MKGIILVIVLAIIVEALIEYIKSVAKAFTKDAWKTAVTQITAAVIAVVLCLCTGADLFAVLGVEFTAPWIGTVLTGIFASRGSNYVSDLISKLQSVGGNE